MNRKKSYSSSSPEIRWEVDKKGNRTKCVYFNGRLYSRTLIKPFKRNGVECGYQGYLRKGREFYTFIISPVFKKGMSSDIWRNISVDSIGNASNLRMIKVKRADGKTYDMPAVSMKITRKGQVGSFEYLGYLVPDSNATYYFPGQGITVSTSKMDFIINN